MYVYASCVCGFCCVGVAHPSSLPHTHIDDLKPPIPNNQTNQIQTKQVRLALDVLSCVETGNYARFFRLLRRAPYVFACLMAKYVDRMRTAAVETMARTFNPAKGRVTQLPLAEVLEALSLLDEAELVEFAEGRQHLLLVEPGSPTVGLRRAGVGEGVQDQQQFPAGMGYVTMCGRVWMCLF